MKTLVTEFISLDGVPIILGRGKTIFAANGKAIPFTLESTVKAGTGAQVCRYARAR